MAGLGAEVENVREPFRVWMARALDCMMAGRCGVPHGPWELVGEIERGMRGGEGARLGESSQSVGQVGRRKVCFLIASRARLESTLAVAAPLLLW
jgi:hypothetical protein